MNNSLLFITVCSCFSGYSGGVWNRPFGIKSAEKTENAPANDRSISMVDLEGFEPLTSAMRTQRSPN